MATYYVKQPNGRIARFTSIVDGFTHMNLSREDAIDLASTRDRRSDPIAAVERALADESALYDEGKPRREDGLKRWHGCLEVLRVKDHAEYEQAVKRGTTPHG